MTPSQSTSLLPCPFCNGAAELRECGGWSGVGCNTNKCPALLHALMFKTAAEAASTWNRRAAATLRGMEKEAPSYRVRWSTSGYVVAALDGRTLLPDELERLLAAQATPHTDHPVGNRCGCNHWTKPNCPARDCPWQGKRPVDANERSATHTDHPAREGLPERCKHGLRWENHCKACDAASVQGMEAQPAPEVTDAMVDAYLQANDAYWKRTDELPTPPNKWRTGTAREATRESLRAAIAAAPAPQGMEAQSDTNARTEQEKPE